MIIDSSALLAIILLEPEEADFATRILLARQPQMSVASYIEVALRLDGALPSGSDRRLDDALETLGVELAPVSIEQAKLARRAFGMFGKGRHPAALNYGDCMTYALAKSTGQPLLFKGNDFIKTDLTVVTANF